jgi:hypothetical protein
MTRLILVLALLLSSVSVRAADVTLGWDPATDGITSGYVVAYGTSPGAYTQQQDVGFVTSAVVSGLVASPYYFAVRAYDATGTLSDYSNEVTTTITGPAITAVSLTSNVASPQQVGFYVTWTAAASGGIAPYQFQFWSQKTGGAWVLGRDWSPVNTWTAAPSIGVYTIRVDAKSAGSLAPELSQSMPFTITCAIRGNSGKCK